ncbi:MAG: T9SS type A sorting domain-containing protein [Candidatus Kapabacteria bacterium]|nr:T9SS type A sorting domain-containing protein [Candidatus Kapabacteria bacterium]
MKIKLTNLLAVILFCILLSTVYLFSECKKSELWTWNCNPGDRERQGWRVVEDTDCDGVFDQQTIKSCNGHVVTCPYPNCAGGFIIGTTPEVESASNPIFIVNDNGWSVIQKDSVLDIPIYTVIRTIIPDSIYIQLNASKSIAIEIPYLQGEYPDILKDIVISPNPVKNKCEIIFNNTASYNVEILISDLLGKKMNSLLFSVKKGLDNNLMIDLSNFPKGRYFINFKSEGLNETRQIIVI